METTENLFLKLFQKMLPNLPADEAEKRLEISGNKINSSHFEKILGYMDTSTETGKGLIPAINRAIKESML